jgi:hypothetical protein
MGDRVRQDPTLERLPVAVGELLGGGGVFTQAIRRSARLPSTSGGKLV